METKNVTIRSNGKPFAYRGEEGSCNEATQSGPPTHSQGHQDQNISKKTEVNQRMAWAREEIKEGIWCYMYCRNYLTDNYKKVYEIWRKRNPDFRMYIDARELINQKKYPP